MRIQRKVREACVDCQWNKGERNRWGRVRFWSPRPIRWGREWGGDEGRREAGRGTESEKQRRVDCLESQEGDVLSKAVVEWTCWSLTLQFRQGPAPQRGSVHVERSAEALLSSTGNETRPFLLSSLGAWTIWGRKLQIQENFKICIVF